jgi:serine/threonine protein kinase
MVTQFHGVQGKCVTLASAQRIPLFVAVTEWAQVYTEIADAISYVHSKGFLHNDIQSDNVIITNNSSSSYHPVLIDFGKCRKLENAKLYKLTKEEQKTYRFKHWHIAPELVRGTHKQSIASDVYSFGVMLKTLKYNKFRDITQHCMNENPGNRLSLRIAKELFSKITCK